MKKHIVFTGGGSAGHVTPNIALIEALDPEQWSIAYIGSHDGVEKKMIATLSIPYYPVRCGKLRRYFSWKNFWDPLNTLAGILQSFYYLKKTRTNIVFSKGGFVALPVVMAAWLARIPVIAHESDMSPGLANRLSFPFVQMICVTFDAAKKYFKHQEKVCVTGTPLRQALFHGSREKGRARCGFHDQKPCLFVMGGGSGSRVINEVIRQGLDELTARFQIIHVCGHHNIDLSLHNRADYYQIDYAQEELPDLLAASDLVISRSGANSLYEILSLQKPHILIPLSLKASRGDQIQNARFFQELGISHVIEEEQLTVARLVVAVDDVMHDRERILQLIQAQSIPSGTEKIIRLLEKI